MTTPLKPGQFRATCNLKKPHPVKDLPNYLRREYDEAGWKKGYRVVRRSNGDYLNTECYLEPLCDGFETTDKVAFEEHMKTLHNRKPAIGEWETFSKSIRRGWVSPRPGREKAPLKKAITELTVTCDGCGLVIERDGRSASELFLREHLTLCTARAGAA